MAVTSSGTGTESSGLRVTGVLKVKDVLINPTKEELENYGVTWKSPDYELNDPERGSGRIIDFYFKVDDGQFPERIPSIILSTRFYLYNSVRKSQNNNIQFINSLGRTAFASDENNLPSYFETKGARPALEGEESIIKFIRAWGDVRGQDDCTLDTIKDIAKGNIKELKELERAWTTRKLKVLVGLTNTGEDKFQHVVYNKDFWRVYANTVYIPSTKATKKFDVGIPELIASDYFEFKKADIVSTEPTIWDEKKLKAHKGKVVVPDPDPDHVPESYDYQKNDLPFEDPELGDTLGPDVAPY
jgi:hypothetical protein